MIGQKINKYRLEEKLGEGGMGVVYKAWDEALERWVALKMLHPTLAEDEKFLKRFRAEARALAKLENPHIVTVFDLQETESGLCIVMQYVEGANLATRLQNRPLPLEAALPIIKQVLTALCHAHQVGVIHRDIKPSNVMLTAQELVKITDFGMAKIHAGMSLTQSTSTGGTLYYMPPEQLKSLAHVDQRCDIYSAGMTFYEMLAGRLPLEKQENLYALSKAIVESKFSSPDHFNAAIPKELSAIVMKAIAKEPEKRYQSAEEMLAATTQCEAMQESQQRELLREPRRRKRRIGVASAFALVLLAGVMLFFILFRQQRSSPVIEAAGPARIDSSGSSPQSEARVDSSKLQPEPAVAAPKQGTLYIESQPSGADILLNNQPRGKTPRMLINLAAGDYTLVLKKAGYRDYSAPIIISAGQEKNIAAELMPLMGKLLVAAKPSGEIYIDGERKRENASDSFETNLPVGPHLIKVAHPEFGRWEKSVDIKSEVPQVIEVDFNKFVTVTVAVTSGWGEIYVDGKPFGEQTPKKIQLRIGKRVIEVRREGYVMEEKAKEINLETDMEEPFVFTLKKP
jgi:serine/threonine protein kinase